MVIYVTRGLPASGKSTWAKMASGHGSRTVRVCRDDIRDMLVGTDRPGVLTREQEELVSRMEEAAVRAAVEQGRDVYVDAMHIRPKYIDKWCTFGHVEVVDFPVPLVELVRRDANRDRPVGEKVIRQIAKRFRIKEDGVLPQITVRNRDFQPYERPENGHPSFIVDIDGTLANLNGRSPYENDSKKYLEDLPIQDVVDTVRDLETEGRVIVFMSGRSETHREATEQWLETHVRTARFRFQHLLLMRGEDDKRPDDGVKYDLFDKHVRDDYDVIGVIDDRPQVLRMWRKIGLTTFQVGSGEEF